MDYFDLEDIVPKNECSSNNNKRNSSCKTEENTGIPVYNTITPDILLKRIRNKKS